MECNKDKAARAKKLAEEKMKDGDFDGAHKFIMKAQRLFPNLENMQKMITICDVHSSANNKLCGLDNWYAILQVQQSADADTIKKQYRKLARLLHPDKNNFAGSEAAFKLVGEAHRYLSDRVKRSQYDMRYRSHSILASRRSAANSSRHCATANKAVEYIASVYFFWACCKHCGHRSKYLREYMDTVMCCSICKRSYIASNTLSGGVPPSGAVKTDPVWQNACTGAESGSSAAEVNKNGTVRGNLSKKKHKNGAGEMKPKKDEGCKEGKAEGGKPQKGETCTDNPVDVLKPQPKDKEPETGAGTSKPDLSAPTKNQAGKKRRKAGEKPTRSFEADGSDVSGAKTDTNEYNNKPSRKNPQFPCAKRGGDSDFVSPPPKKAKSGCKFESDSNTKQKAEDMKSPDLADFGATLASLHASKGKAKKSENFRNKDILSAKNIESEGCNGNEKNGAFSSKVDKVFERHKKISLAVGKISSEMEERGKEIKAVETKASELNARSQIFRQDVKHNEKKLDFPRNQIEFGERKLVQAKREIEESAREIKATESEASDLSVKSERFRQEDKGKERELHLLKNYRLSEEKKLTQLKRKMEKENDRRKKDLEVILSKIQESGKQLVAVNERLESQQKLLDTQSMELVSKNMELESVAESSKRLKVDLREKEKSLHTLKNLLAISSEQLNLKSKELGEVEKLIEEQTEKLCGMQQQQPPATPINDTSQQNAAAAEPVDEDVLMDHESSESLVPDEVSIALRASPNPAEFVLDLVQEQIQEESGLEVSVVEILVLLLDELAKIQRPDKSQLKLRATEVATLWKRKTIHAPKFSLEALAFLLFIVAYGLEKLVNQEETVLLASSISQYKQAPTLFNSLGLKPEMIPEIVSELIKQRHYIPAVRFICHFKLTKNFPPSDLLMEEIANLRRSVLEKRPTGSSQAKDKNTGRLRDILEVVADYELKIDLPGDLVAKLMV